MKSSGSWSWCRLGSILVLLLGTGVRADLTEVEKWHQAEKVGLVEIVHFGWRFRGPESTIARPYDVQTLWVKYSTQYKGDPPPEKWGYDVVRWPIRGRKRYRLQDFDHALGPSSLPRDPAPLMFLVRDRDGVLTPLRGREGVYLYPGGSRRKRLEAWKKSPPRVPTQSAPPKAKGRTKANPGARGPPAKKPKGGKKAPVTGEMDFGDGDPFQDLGDNQEDPFEF